MQLRDMKHMRVMRTENGIKSMTVDGCEYFAWTFAIDLCLAEDPAHAHLFFPEDVGAFYPDEIGDFLNSNGYDINICATKDRAYRDPVRYKYDYRAVLTERDSDSENPTEYVLGTGDTFFLPANGETATILRRRNGNGSGNSSTVSESKA